MLTLTILELLRAVLQPDYLVRGRYERVSGHHVSETCYDNVAAPNRWNVVTRHSRVT